jgi:hypothetical protein
MKFGEFARDLNEAPTSEDKVTVVVAGSTYEVAAVQFVAGEVQILTAEAAPAAEAPVALGEQTAADQAAIGGSAPAGHADAMNRSASGAGIAADMRTPIQDDQVVEDSGT